MSGRGTILVVDDEEDVRRMLSSALALRGYEVVAAACGEEAVAIAEHRAFVLALCDLKMPGIDGAETTAALKQLQPRLPIVICTGFLSEESLAVCRERGACDYLRKPFSLEDLHRTIERNLARQKIAAS